MCIRDRISSTVLEDYEQGQLDEVWILYTQMINSMKMEAEIVQLLPLKREDFSNIVIPPDIIQEEIQMVPSPSAVMDNVVPNYVTGFIFGALVESFCSEQNARMMAMQSASDNANAILSDLSIEYNRVRQAAITQEDVYKRQVPGRPEPSLYCFQGKRRALCGGRAENREDAGIHQSGF